MSTWFRWLARLAWVTAGLAATTGPSQSAQATPGLFSVAGDRSVVLHWPMSPNQPGRAYHIERASGDDGFERLTSQPVRIQGFVDTAVQNGFTYRYRLLPAEPAANPETIPEETKATPGSFADEPAFLDYVQRCAFAYFWYEANPANGLVRDRSTPGSPSSIAATGFGLTALTVGVDRGWISRLEGRDRTLTTLRFFNQAPQSDLADQVSGHRGWFYHFLDLRTGCRVWRCELSSVDTAWLLAGVLDVRQFFAGADPEETRLRLEADRLLRAVDWSWMLAGGQTLSMGWRPEEGFLANRWVGYNEAMLLYLLGLGAKGSGLAPTSWAAWCQGYRWASHYGQTFIEFPPLFGHQYSHCWIDFRGLQDAYTRDRGIDYFENSRRATLAQQAYCRANPGRFPGYSDRVWGLTACDGPGTAGYQAYGARGAPPAAHDDGTLAPTAVGGSTPFAPEICLPTLRYLYDMYREHIWRPYGFCDAFNLKAGWWAPDVLGIDQGPILIMLENHRTGRVWKRCMQAPELQLGLQRAGFSTNRASPR